MVENPNWQGELRTTEDTLNNIIIICVWEFSLPVACTSCRISQWQEGKFNLMKLSGNLATQLTPSTSPSTLLMLQRLGAVFNGVNSCSHVEKIIEIQKRKRPPL